MNTPSADEHGPAAATPDGARKRPPELEDWLNRHLYHPLSFRLARLLARTPVTPNMVSLAGGLAVALAAYFYAALSYPLSALLGLGVHMSWHVLDGADGDLARMTGKVSPTGEFVDGLCDYLGHIVMYLTLASLVVPLLGIWAWPLGVFAGLSRAAQSNFYESLRRNYEEWAYGREWLGSPEKQSKDSPRLVRAYLRGANSLLPLANDIGPLIVDPQIAPAARHIIARHKGALLAGLEPFGANYRTIALGAAMMVQMPALYLVYEAVVLNIAAVWMVRRKRRMLNMIFSQLSNSQPSRTLR
ncbi:MAG: CDP-alcohol phosphatidyltransferase family protein [Alteraurantiacibacter sp. bin_em_oilr2.035]|nr:CDP-alcohol phosphatidyltransferase family protein [Alteraurantiacibacter sp. bin_em_oilr2.035]